MSRMMKRFTVPDGLDFKTIVIRELTGDDELQAAIWADANKSSASDSMQAAFKDEQRETIRLSIAQVDGQAVNIDGMPFRDMDNWGFRSLRYLREFHADLNGVEISELKNAVEEAEVITTGTSTTNPEPA